MQPVCYEPKYVRPTGSAPIVLPLLFSQQYKA